MKKVFLFFVILPLVLFYNSCTKDKIPATAACTQTDTLNTYTKSVKPIMENSCSTFLCHDATASGGLVLTDYTTTVNGAKNNPKFFCAIDHSCNPIMPQGAPKLADSLIAKINAWKANCYAQ